MAAKHSKYAKYFGDYAKYLDLAERNKYPIALAAILLGAVILGAFFVTGMNRSETTSANLAERETAADGTLKPNYTTVLVKALKRERAVIATGTIVADKTSNLGPIVEGRIEKIHVDSGDRVEKGDPLFETRRVTFDLKAKEAKAGLAMTKARVDEARLSFERIDKLFKRGSASAATRDTALSKLQVAQAEAETAAVKLQYAERDLKDSVMRAPFRGVVTERFVDEGVYLTNRATGGSGAGVVQLQKIDVLMAVMGVPSRDLPKIKAGDPVSMQIDGMPEPVEAKISVINDRVDAVTRTAEIRVKIDNKDYRIRSGVFVMARIKPELGKALVIPKAAVVTNNEGPIVYRLVNGKAVRTAVQIERRDRKAVEVVSGLREGERVIMGPGLNDLSDGFVIGRLSDVDR